jgi:hypothetical protein
MGFPGKAGDIMPSAKIREDGLTYAGPDPTEGVTELRWEQSQSDPPEVERTWMIEIIKTDKRESLASYRNDS